MTTVAANPLDPLPIRRGQDPALKKFLIYSLVLHGGLLIVAVVFSFVHFGENWGGVGAEPGNGTPVKLVRSAGIPLPPKTNVTDSTVVDPTKGLHKEEKKPVEPPKPAEKIPDFKNERRLPPTKASKRDPVKTPEADNDINYGKKGSPDLPTGYDQAPGAGPNDVAIKGEGAADFASRYGWYIEGVRNRIYSNWQQWNIDAAARASRTIRCSITFTINKDGSITDARISQSSGNYSYDNSALRAVLSSNPVTKLPSDYSGSRVTAILDFNPPGIQ